MTGAKSAAFIFPNGKRNRALLSLSLFPVVHIYAVLASVGILPGRFSQYRKKILHSNASVNLVVLLIAQIAALAHAAFHIFALPDPLWGQGTMWP